MRIQGNKIYLRVGLREENYPLMLRGIHNLEVMRYVGWAKKAMAIKNVPQLKKFIARLKDGVFFGIYGKTDNFIGYAWLANFNNKQECELAIFILDKNYWRKGIGKEVASLMINHAFNFLGFEKIVISVSELHLNAIKLFEKIGFKKTSLIPRHRNIFYDGEWILNDKVEMAIENKQTQRFG